MRKSRLRGGEFFYQVFNEAKATHGPIYFTFLGPEFRLRIHDLDFVKGILGDQSGVFEKPQLMKEVLGRVLGEGLVTSEGAQHKMDRSLISPAFNWLRLRGMSPLMVQATDTAIQSWIARTAAVPSGKLTLDFHHEISAVTLEIIGHAAFGADMEGSSAELVYNAVATLLEAAVAHVTSGAAFIPMHRHLPFPSTLRTNAKIAQLKALLLAIIAKRRRQRLAQQALRESKAADPSSDSASEDGELLVDYLLDAREARESHAGSSPPSDKRAGSSGGGGRAFTDDQVMDHAITFALAGHETTSQALCWTVMLLCRHPQWKARVRAQVLAVCGRDRAPTYEDASQMPLLNMVLQESMRLYPPVPFIVRTAARAVVLGPTPTGATLNIAAGTSIVIPIAGIHRDPELYPDPDVFNPLRFEHGISKACPHPFGYLPFSHGIRNCIGAQFALMEARLVLARLLQRLDFELDPSYVHQPSPFITLRPGHGMPLRVWSLPVDTEGVTGVTSSGDAASDRSRAPGSGAVSSTG